MGISKNTLEDIEPKLKKKTNTQARSFMEIYVFSFIPVGRKTGEHSDLSGYVNGERIVFGHQSDNKIITSSIVDT
jgi:hypothetical protein